MKLFLIFTPLIAGIIGLCLGIGIGHSTQKKVDLQHCKQAGWAFVDQVIIDRKFAENHPRGKKYGMRLLLSLHANIATKCINRIK